MLDLRPTPAAPERACQQRRFVAESWQRSRRHLPDASTPCAPLALEASALRDYRSAHPLTFVRPVVQRLLIEPCRDTGILVAVADEHGRLLWVDGDPQARLRAERILFTPGADWSEAAIGTSAPGTALALGRGVQVSGPEHFSEAVRRWSCTAVPLRDPDTGRLLGVIDLTGDDGAVAAHTMALVHAAVAAAEGELALARLRGQWPCPDDPPAAGARLDVLGPVATLRHAGQEVQLSLRHAEILTLLARHREGLRAAELLDLINPDLTETTLRAEIVRLRRVLERTVPGLVVESRPYRLRCDLEVDAHLVADHLSKGSHEEALSTYTGPLLPDSTAPGICALRAELSATLREAVVGDASAGSLMTYLDLAEARCDVEAWRTALSVLPARSPLRAGVVAHLEALDRDLAAPARATRLQRSPR